MGKRERVGEGKRGKRESMKRRRSKRGECMEDHGGEESKSSKTGMGKGEEEEREEGTEEGEREEQFERA